MRDVTKRAVGGAPDLAHHVCELTDETTVRMIYAPQASRRSLTTVSDIHLEA
jgi:hypothetical protein